MGRSINPDSRLLPVGVSQGDILAMLKAFRAEQLPVNRPILPLHAGGTGSNLSATGGANQFLAQATAGGPVTVGVLPAVLAAIVAAGGAYAVGDIHISTSATNPATTLGYGTWTAFGTGRVLIGVDTGDADFNTVEKTGGAKTVAAAGTNSGTVIADHTPTQPTISWPAGVPTNANESSHTHTAGAISWPAGVPTFAGSALATHQHELPFIQPAGAVVQRNLAASVFGTGTSRASATRAGSSTADTNSAAVMLSEGVSAGTPAGTISWPAGVPTAAATGAGSAHTHTISWPTGVPTAAGGGVNAHSVTTQPIFAGSATSVVQPYITCYFWKRTA